VVGSRHSMHRRSSGFAAAIAASAFLLVPTLAILMTLKL
jgi:hypothetical protein